MIDTFLFVMGTVIAVVVAVLVGAALSDHADRRGYRDAISEAAKRVGADFSRSTHGCGRSMIAIDPSGQLLCAAGKGLPQVVVVKADQITGVEIGDGSIQIAPAKRKSVAGRALVGGVLFGGVGAAVGAASGVGGKEAEMMPLYYLNIFTVHPDLPHHSVVFPDHNSAQIWRGLILSMQHPRDAA